SGCSAIFDGNVGYARSLSRSRDHDGVSHNGNIDFGGGGDDGGAGFGFGFRNKVASHYRQFAMTPHLYALAQTKPMVVYGRAGITLLQVDNFSGDGGGTNATIGSPVGEVGLMIHPERFDICGFEAVTSLEYDHHTGDRPNEGFWNVGLGFGCAAAGSPF